VKSWATNPFIKYGLSLFWCTKLHHSARAMQLSQILTAWDYIKHSSCFTGSCVENSWSFFTVESFFFTLMLKAGMRRKSSKESHHSGIFSSSTHVNETANHAGWNHSPGGFSLRSIEATKFPCGDGSGWARALHMPPSWMMTSQQQQQCGVWATLFSSRPSWMMTSQQQQQRARRCSFRCHFAFVT
jgi:hypothetical protein